MTRLLLAEARKLWTLRTTWILTAVGIALVTLTSMSQAFGDMPGGADRVAAAVSEIGANSLIVLVVALLVMTTEFRHATIGRTLQLEPSRTRVLLGKLGVGALYATLFFALSLAVVAVVLGVGALTGGVTLRAGGELGRLLWQGLAALVLTALLGVAVGALVRSQVVAIAGALVWLVVVENLAAALRPDLGRWLPFQALNAVFLSDVTVEPGMVAPLAPAVALAVVLAYVAVATGAAATLMSTRDV